MEFYQNELLNQFIRYHNLLNRYQHQSRRQRGPGMDIMRGQGRVLSILKMKPEITQKELAYLLDMRVQSLSELLAKLEAKGQVTRTPSEADRRVMVVKLTEEGAAAVGDTAPADTDAAFSCLTEEERETLGGYLERLIAAMEAELAKLEEENHSFGKLRDRFQRMGGPDGQGFHGNDPRGGFGGPGGPGGRGFDPRGFGGQNPPPPPPPPPGHEGENPMEAFTRRVWAQWHDGPMDEETIRQFWEQMQQQEEQDKE